MHYIIWVLPAVSVLALIVVVRSSMIVAAASGTVIALLVSLLFPPETFSIAQSIEALSRGAWIGWVVMPYILGGLLFWQIAAAQPARLQAAPPKLNPLEQRRLLFTACFLIGPFAESATGFGIGMLGTLSLIRRLPISPPYLLVFALMSQTLAPWGGLGSGSIVGAAMAGVSPTTLAVTSCAFVAALMLVWIPLFWRAANKSGFVADRSELISEALWIVAGLSLLTVSTYFLGPETACLASYGPLIVVRFLMTEKPDLPKMKTAALRVLPYVALISVLASMRIITPLKEALLSSVNVTPFDGLPSWAPLFHAGTWLFLVALIIALLQNRIGAIGDEITKAWKTGQGAVYTTFLFSMMAEILSQSHISAALADGLQNVFHDYVILFMPLLAGAFSMLTNSGTASNGLFMNSQVALAKQTGLSIILTATLQHVAAGSFSLFSPLRLFMAATMAGAIGHERAAYRLVLPFILSGFMIMVIAAGIILLIGN